MSLLFSNLQKDIARYSGCESIPIESLIGMIVDLWRDVNLDLKTHPENLPCSDSNSLMSSLVWLGNTLQMIHTAKSSAFSQFSSRRTASLDSIMADIHRLTQELESLDQDNRQAEQLETQKLRLLDKHSKLKQQQPNLEALEAEVAQLQTSIADYEARLASLAPQKLDDLRSKNNDLKEQVNTLSESIAELKLQIENETARIASLEKQKETYNSLIQENAGKMSTVHTLDAQIQTVTEQNRALEQERSNKEQEKNHLFDVQERLNIEVLPLRTFVETLAKSNAELSAELEKLPSKKQKLDDEHHDLETKISTLTTDNKALRERCDSLLLILNEQNTKKEVAERRKNELLSDLERLRSETETTEQAANALEKQIEDELQPKLKDANRRKSEADQRILEINNNLKNIDETTNKLNQEIDALRQSMTDQDHEALHAQLTRQKAKLKTLVESIEQMNIDLGICDGQIQELMPLHKATEEKLTERNSEVERLSNEISNFEISLENLSRDRAPYNKMEVRYASLKSIVQALTQDSQLLSGRTGLKPFTLDEELRTAMQYMRRYLDQVNRAIERYTKETEESL